MEEFTQKWAIIALLDDTKEGSVFHFTEFPMHITIAGVFDTDQNGRQLADQLSKLLRDQRSFTVEAGPKDMFGPNKDVPVMRTNDSIELMTLYQKIHTWLTSLGATYLQPQYQGEGYLPHSTIQKSGALREGEHRLIQSVSLVDLYPNNDGRQRKIFKTITLEK